MSHVSRRKRGWVPCEFAALHDCDKGNEDDYCSIYQDPDDCEKYHRRMVLEGEETKAEFDAWKANKAWADKHREACYSFDSSKE